MESSTTSSSNSSDFERIKEISDRSNLQYVRVKRNDSKGFWEINKEKKVALFRDRSHRIDPNTEIKHDWTDVYETITEYLLKEHKTNFVKEIIPDIKYIFSNDLFCSHYRMSNASHNPNAKIHCTESATVYRVDILGKNNPLCEKHSKLFSVFANVRQQ